MLPRLGSQLVTRWIGVTLAASIVAFVDGGWLASWVALTPSRILHGEVWRLVTWSFIETTPLSLIVTCAAIYKFGSELAVRWGDRRLRRFMLEVVIAAGVITCLVAAALGSSYLRRLGGWAATDALVIAWARQFPERSVVLHGMIELRGEKLVRAIVATMIVFAIYFGPVVMAPELVACALAAGYPRARLRR